MLHVSVYVTSLPVVIIISYLMKIMSDFMSMKCWESSCFNMSCLHYFEKKALIWLVTFSWRKTAVGTYSVLRRRLDSSFTAQVFFGGRLRPITDRTHHPDHKARPPASHPTPQPVRRDIFTKSAKFWFQSWNAAKTRSAVRFRPKWWNRFENDDGL